MRGKLKTSDAPALVTRQAGWLPGRVPGKQRPHEGSFVTEHAAAVVPDAVRFDEVRVGAEQGTVSLIGSETGEAEQRQGLVAGPFGRAGWAGLAETYRQELPRGALTSVGGRPRQGDRVAVKTALLRLLGKPGAVSRVTRVPGYGVTLDQLPEARSVCCQTWLSVPSA